jgi:hypothetical protein
VRETKSWQDWGWWEEGNALGLREAKETVCDRTTYLDVAIGSIPLTALLGLGKQNLALFRCHFPFDCVEKYSLDGSLCFA